MKLHVVANPKVKTKLLEWMKTEQEEEGKSTFTQIKNGTDLLTIMKDMKADFILDPDKPYSVLACEQQLFLIEMPTHPLEIFSYADRNPDKLSNFIMQMAIPLLKIFLMQMFDQQIENKYE